MANPENDGAVAEQIDPIRERSRPVKLHPPKFSDAIDPETARYHRDIAEAIEAESSKNWQMRREMERVDRMGVAVTRLTSSVDQWAQSTKDMIAANGTTQASLAALSVQSKMILDLLTTMTIKMDKAFDEIRKLENANYDNENAIELLKGSHGTLDRRISSIEQRKELTDKRLAALETIQLVENSEKAGQEKLITRGKAVAGASVGAAVGIVSNWNHIINWLKGHL